MSRLLNQHPAQHHLSRVEPILLRDLPLLITLATMTTPLLAYDIYEVKTDMHYITHTMYRTNLGLLGKSKKTARGWERNNFRSYIRSVDDVRETQATRPPLNP